MNAKGWGRVGAHGECRWVGGWVWVREASRSSKRWCKCGAPAACGSGMCGGDAGGGGPAQVSSAGAEGGLAHQACHAWAAGSHES